MPQTPGTTLAPIGYFVMTAQLPTRAKLPLLGRRPTCSLREAVQNRAPDFPRRAETEFTERGGSRGPVEDESGVEWEANRDPRRRPPNEEAAPEPKRNREPPPTPSKNAPEEQRRDSASPSPRPKLKGTVYNYATTLLKRRKGASAQDIDSHLQKTASGLPPKSAQSTQIRKGVLPYKKNRAAGLASATRAQAERRRDALAELSRAKKSLNPLNVGRAHKEAMAPKAIAARDATAFLPQE